MPIPVYENTDTCPICWDDFIPNETHTRVQLLCGHVYHIECVTEQLIANVEMNAPICCATCRKAIPSL